MAVQSSLVVPRVVYTHKETTNQSFIDIHYYLKSVGVQNNDFFLALLDPGLASVDPRDPQLSTFMKTRVMNECRHNYWYFLREVVRVPDQGGSVSGGKRYILNRGNLALSYLSIYNFNVYIEMPRQTGKTVGAEARYLWDYNFGTTNSEIMFLHKDHGGSKKNLKDVKTYRDALPSYLQLSSATGANKKQLKVPNTIIAIENPHNHNKITTFPSSRSRASADNLGRGLTMPLQWYDEFAFIPYNRIVYNAATPAFSRASQNARANGAPYGIVLSSTPGDMLTDSGSYAYDIVHNSTPWNDKFYDFTYQQLYDLKAQNTNTSFWYIKYTYQQLGFGPEYFKEQVINLNKDWAAIRREILLEWAQISENAAFHQEDLDIIDSQLRDPIRTIEFGRYKQYSFLVYEDIDLRYPPIIGVDVAGGTYQDSSAITVIDSRTTRVCATFNCNYISTDDLAEVIYELVTKYMPNAVVNIERNGVGHGVVGKLKKTSIKKNLYWEIKDKVIEEAYNGIRMEKTKRKVRVYGLDSTHEIRNRLIELLYERVQYHKDKFVARVIKDEMAGMQYKKNGKVEHSDQTHDDQVFSYLLALYVWYDGQNLVDNWRIMKNTLKTDEDEDFEENIVSNYEGTLESLDLHKATSDVETDKEILDTVEWVERNAKLITAEDMLDMQSDEIVNLRSYIMSNNKDAREAYAKQTGVDESSFVSPSHIQNQVTLPMSLFDLDDDNFDPFNDDPDEYDMFAPKRNSYYQGNLVDILSKIN